MFNINDFNNRSIGEDPYEQVRAVNRFDDLKPKEDTPIKLSIIMSVFHRYSQLQRTLETLCRQTFKDFEVLIFDNGDDQNINEVITQFAPYLHVYYIRKDSDMRVFDPSLALSKLYPLCDGEVVAFMQPECMLYQDATYWLYWGHYLPKEEMADKVVYHKRNGRTDTEGETCVCLKTLFSSEQIQPVLDAYDWHTNVANLHNIPGFWEESYGLAHFSNQIWLDYKESSWWFVHSYKQSAKIWEHIPVFKGHAGIDFFTIFYREINNYLEIMPKTPLAFHQEHHRMSWSPDTDQQKYSKEYIMENCKE